jgi:hypothetical protein
MLGLRTPKVTGSVRVHARSYSDLDLKSNVWFRHARQLRLPRSHDNGFSKDESSEMLRRVFS